MFETRDPARRAWEGWNREASHRVVDVPGTGPVEYWVELLDVSGPLVTFRWTYVLAVGRETLTSTSTLRFRRREEVEAALTAQGYVLDEVRDAPDRPGRELVFLTRRPEA